jgi:hypothetical protein
MINWTLENTTPLFSNDINAPNLVAPRREALEGIGVAYSAIRRAIRNNKKSVTITTGWWHKQVKQRKLYNVENKTVYNAYYPEEQDDYFTDTIKELHRHGFTAREYSEARDRLYGIIITW